MLFNSYSYEISYEQFHWIYLQGDIKLLLVTVNNRLRSEIEIVHDLLCHPIQTFPYPTASKSFLYSNAFMTKSGAQSLTFKSVTNRQTKTQRFWLPWRRVKSEPNEAWQGDRGPRARSCTFKILGVWRIVWPLWGAEYVYNQTLST